MTSHILRSIEQKRVTFDPTNEEHLEAFNMLVLGTSEAPSSSVVKQHPKLRFVLEDGFVDVRSMMLHKVGRQYVKVIDSFKRKAA